MTIGMKLIRVKKIGHLKGHYYILLNNSWDRIPSIVAKDIMCGNNILPLVSLIKDGGQIYYLSVFRLMSGKYVTFQFHNRVPDNSLRIVWEEKGVE